MPALRLDRLWDFFAGMGLLVSLLWLGLAALTIALLILMQTHWGQSRPLRKCVVLSLLAHLLLAGYATTVEVVAGGTRVAEPVFRVSLVDSSSPESAATEETAAAEKPWEQLPHEAAAQPDQVDPQRQPHDEPPEPQRRNRSEPADLKSDPPLDHLTLAEAQQPEPGRPEVSETTGRLLPAKSPEEIEVPAAQRRDSTGPSLPDAATPERPLAPGEVQPARARALDTSVPAALLEPTVPPPRLAATATAAPPADSLAALTDRLSQPAPPEPADPATMDAGHSRPGADPGYEAAGVSAGGEPEQPWRSSVASPGGNQPGGADDPGLPRGDAGVAALPQSPRDRAATEGWPAAAQDQPRRPEIYGLRTAPDRSRLAGRQGATAATEKAVSAALKWLADNQEPDGRWDADRHGAGKELLVGGRDRQGTGIQADTAMTGLALLAFLAAGHTHREGPYQENVRRGLDYLLSIQAADGNLSGSADTFAAMYCHAMAACAMSEAYGMTGDQRLQRPVRRAIGYTIAAQDPAGGGFRYRPGDPGDTSQCGWQLMALKSADLAGITMPRETRNGLIRFLRSVSAGEHGGLASYRPNEPVTRPMTAEALVCWQFLGMPREHPAGNEAGDYLLGELPGRGEANLYYWYYATLGMYQLQGAYWARWNDALQTTLVDSQRTSGPLAGSWDPVTLWDGYGGRVYSTALSALCLEVYYRFLPLYGNAVVADAPAK
jgi:hypothetical protein